jgi:hypothetical protein
MRMSYCMCCPQHDIRTLILSLTSWARIDERNFDHLLQMRMGILFAFVNDRLDYKERRKGT